MEVSCQKFKAIKIGISKIDAGESSGRIEFSSNTSVDPMAIVQLVQKHPQRYRLEGATKLKFELKAKDTDSKLIEVDDLLSLLIPK